MSKTVLIIDDAYFMRNLLKKALKEAGYEVIGEAKNGKEGIKLYFELKPEIVTMDINMPDITGIEATKQIISKDPHAKIIAVTGNNDDDIKRQILEAGVKEYLQKPFQPAFLWNKIDKMLEEPATVAVEEEKILVEKVPIKPISPTPVVVAEAVEDDFDEFEDNSKNDSEDESKEELEIEIMDKPDESKSMTLVIENEEDFIEFPSDYQKLVKEEQEEFGLTKEKVEEEDLIELEDNQTLLELENHETFIELENPETFIEIGVEEAPAPTIKEPTIKRPVLEQAVSKTPVPPRKPESKPIVHSKRPQQQEDVRPVVEKPPVKKETIVSSVEITKSKKTDRKIEEISIRPQGNFSGRDINIRPPRGRILREDDDRIGETEVDEPILNVSDKDNYNDKNDGLFGIVKKLFKK